MNRLVFILLSLISCSLSAQDSILTSRTLFPFILNVDSLNDAFLSFKPNDYYGIQQASADYVRIITRDPQRFMNDLDAGMPPEEILINYANSVVDKDLFIIKTKSPHFNKEISILFQTLETGSLEGHSVRIPYDETTYHELALKGRYFYSHYVDDNDGTTRIDAFYIRSDFHMPRLDPAIGSSIDYADLVIGREEVFKGSKPVDLPDLIMNPIDSLTNFFDRSTGKPIWQKEDSYPHFKERMKEWEQKKGNLSDSLFLYHRPYRDLIVQSLAFAKDYHLSNSLLEYLVARYVSTEEALELMRQSPVRGKQSYDPAPVDQYIRLCMAAAEVSNWGVWIKSMIQLMDDNMERSVESSLARASRRTYINEIEKLPIDLPKLLVGMSLNVSNPSGFHYLASAG